MKKNLIQASLLILTVVLSVTGCSLFGSSEATITGITSDDIVGDVTINLENNTAVVTVRPMDLSAFKPTITVSEKAVVTLPEKLEDGIAAVYTVTAENGSSVEWKVTYNVQYGISFRLDGIEYVFTHGVSDTENPANNKAHGDGVPGIWYGYNNIYSVSLIFEQFYDEGAAPNQTDFDYAFFLFEGRTIGTYNNQNFVFDDFSTKSRYYFDATFNVIKYEDLDGNFTTTFYGTETAPGIKKVTNGFAKLRVVVSYPV